tara:strand:- start:412 stop:666 length:255 start_codon:yes stop_codon:yes gene_type:complete
MDYKVTYYLNTGSYYIDPNPTIKYFEFHDDMEDWINEEVDRRVDFTIQHSPYSVSEEERAGMEEWERCHIKIEENGQIIKDKFI